MKLEEEEETFSIEHNPFYKFPNRRIIRTKRDSFIKFGKLKVLKIKSQIE